MESLSKFTCGYMEWPFTFKYMVNYSKFCVTYMYVYMIHIGHRPTLKLIHDIVKPEVNGVTTKWYDLGVQLLDNDAGVLDVIKTDHPNDARVCCSQMFNKWLERKSGANWSQLITALIKINLNTIAESVRNSVHKGKIIIYIL